MSGEVHAFADQLRQYATHFEMRDWDYTRDLGDLVAIRHNGQHDALEFRLRMALRALFRVKRDRVFNVSRWRMFRTHLRRDSHLPDGILDGGAIAALRDRIGVEG